MIFRGIAFALLALEIAITAIVIGVAGFFGAVFLWFVGVVAGTSLVRAQGLATLGRAQASFDRGAIPADAVFDSFCLLAAGLLLIFPGFLSDIIALALLIPFVRNKFKSGGVNYFDLKPDRRSASDGAIDGVYERVPDPPAGELPPKT